jgi:hypothetical protein
LDFILKGMIMTRKNILIVVLTACMMGCGGSGNGGSAPPPNSNVTVSVSGALTPLNTGATRTFTATVTGSSNPAVTWSVVEADGGSITQAGLYTAPTLPGTYTVKAVAQANSNTSGKAAVPVIIPEGSVPGYSVGVDYHAYAADFNKTAFVTIYNQPSVRQTVRTQLQAMADRGAATISTRVWFVTEPGTTNFGDTWRATFPMTDQEESNLRTYAQDVAAVQGSGGNRLRMDICLLWLGAADYSMGTPSTGLGFTPVTAAVFTSRVQTTTDRVLAAVSGVTRPDGVPVVNIIYLNGGLLVGATPNEEWFMTTHYPRFVSAVTQAGFTPSVYFSVTDTQDDVLQNDYVDVQYPILNNHRSMFWVYRAMRFMVDQGLPLPARTDFAYYVPSTGATYSDLLTRVLNDADATLPSLGAAQSYGAAEAFYFIDDTQRHQYGQAFATEAASSPRLKSATFWTTPDGGGTGINVAYPFAFEDYLAPP